MKMQAFTGELKFEPIARELQIEDRQYFKPLSRIIPQERKRFTVLSGIVDVPEFESNYKIVFSLQELSTEYK